MSRAVRCAWVVGIGLLPLVAAGIAQSQQEYGYKAADANFLGRLTYQFSAGAELANDDESFSKVTPHLRLDLDTIWRDRADTVDAGYLEALEENVGMDFSSLPVQCEEAVPGKPGETREKRRYWRDSECKKAIKKKQLIEIFVRTHVPEAASCTAQPAFTAHHNAVLNPPAGAPAPDPDAVFMHKSLVLPLLAAGAVDGVRDAWLANAGRVIRNEIHRSFANDKVNVWARALLNAGLVTCAVKHADTSAEEAKALGVPLPQLTEDLRDDGKARLIAKWEADAIDALSLQEIRELGNEYFSRFVAKRRLDWRNFHTRVGFQLGTIPTDKARPTGRDQFIEAKKALTAELAADYLVARLDAFGGSLRFGPTVLGGFQTVEEEQEGEGEGRLDNVNGYWGVGARLVEGHSETLDVMNPPTNRYVAVHWGKYEAIKNKRWTFDARLQPNGGGPFVAFRSIVGKGSDDVRVIAGVAVSPEEVGKFIIAALNPAAILGSAQKQQTEGAD